jgi:intermembrane space import and assembly protein 40
MSALTVGGLYLNRPVLLSDVEKKRELVHVEEGAKDQVQEQLNSEDVKKDGKSQEQSGDDLAEALDHAKSNKDLVEAAEGAKEQTKQQFKDGEGEGEGESEPAQQSAYNPETGEINWDCPCLGGMANGPCGEEFKEAFSCFVYSEADPKGIDCVEKFKNMQNCFRKYPEIYSEEIRDDETPVDNLEPEQHPGAPVHEVSKEDTVTDV